MHKPVAALKHPPFNRNALSVPPALLTRSHTPSAANQRRFFDDLSDALLERIWVVFGTHFEPTFGLKCCQNGFENQRKIDTEKVLEIDAKIVEK